MPELPEVETMCRGIKAVEGAKIIAVARPPCKKRPIEIQPRIDRIHRRLSGQKISRVSRLGKKVVIISEKNDHLVIEPRMTGLVLIDQPPDNDYLRLEIQLKSRTVDRVLFWDQRGLGKVFCYSEKEYASLLASGIVGPDALEISPEEMSKRMGTSSQPVKVALLDQKKVAGVGNLYASEILFDSRIDPRAKCSKLTRSHWKTIHDNMVLILNRAIESEGSTLSDGTYRNALNDPGQYQNQHHVYDRADEMCPNCGKAKIKRIVQAQRSTFFCQRCQTKGRSK